MSLEHKIKEWESRSIPTFERLKMSLGKEELHFSSHSSQRSCYKRDSFDFKYQKCKECMYLYSN